MITTVTELISSLQEALNGGTSNSFALYDEAGQAYEISDAKMQGDGAPISIQIVKADWS